MKKKITTILVSSVVLLVLMACSLGSFTNDANSDTTTTESPSTSSQTMATLSIPEITDETGVLSMQDTLIALYNQVNPGVVAIITVTDQGSGLGSGFVYDMEGNIVTNDHVVEGATTIEVDFPSGYKTYGEVVGTDPDSDIAVIHVDVPASELHPLTMGDSDRLEVGQVVVAIGNPFNLDSSMSMGIVSALGRTMDSLRASPSGSYFSTGDLIQTDAALNPGNSGGPLLNLYGEVVGINRAIQTTATVTGTESGNIGIGFAVSSNIVRRVVPELIDNGVFQYPYIGMSSRDNLSLIELDALGLPANTMGAYVISVNPGGPAEAAGLRGGSGETSIQGLYSGGDIITAVDGHPVTNFSDFLTYLVINKGPGQDVTLTVLRDGESIDVTLTLGARS
ncbi:MAG TPA: trypsin-like peptidase domain-containing protein [Longilinea sp.]|nr:trypsin-like peptidase domain-containing protein [Longilinea sp.]